MSEQEIRSAVEPEEEKTGGFDWRGLAAAVLLGGTITALTYHFNWVLGTVVFLLWLLIVVILAPTKIRPYLWVQYMVVTIAVPVGEFVDWVLGQKAMRFVFPSFAVRLHTVLAIVVGLLAGGGLTALFIFAVWYVTQKFVLAFDQEPMGDPKQLKKFLCHLMFGHHQNVLLIADGKVVKEDPPGVLSRFGGPGQVVIRPGNAVVFERAGEVTRIVGPGVYQLKRFEVVKKIVDLRPQFTEVTAKDVLTRDRVPLNITLGISFRVETKEETDQREGLLNSPVIGQVYRVYAEIVHRAVYNMPATAPGWEAAPPAAAVARLRDIVARYNFDEIFQFREAEEEELQQDPRTIRAIEEEILENLSGLREALGIHVSGVDIRQIGMPEDVREQVLEVWKTDWQSRIEVQLAESERRALVTRALGERDALRARAEGERAALVVKGEAQAEALSQVERVKARAVEDLVNQLLRGIREIGREPPREDVLAKFVWIVERLSATLISDDLIASRYIEALERIALSDTAKTVIIGEDRRITRLGERGGETEI